MRASVAVVALLLSACAAARAPELRRPTHAAAEVAARTEPARMPEPAPPALEERWYFEWLSRDGKRALLRRIDARAVSRMQARVVDVDTGAILDDAPLEELGNLPDEADPGDRLGTEALADDLVRAARIVHGFPFGSCARFSAAPDGASVAFNAGDFVFAADRSGRAAKRVVAEPAYDPRFFPDGKHLVFRRASGKIDGVLAKYELFVVPSDLSAEPRRLAGTAGARGRFAVDDERRVAIAIASHEPRIQTCALSISLRAPFAVKKLACLPGGEPLVDAVLSPKGRWAALTTLRDRRWHVRVLSLDTKKVVVDEPSEPGYVVRAVSDGGLVVQSGPRGAFVDDLASSSTPRARRDLDLDVGHRAFFRSATELVYVRGSTVALLDLAAR